MAPMRKMLITARPRLRGSLVLVAAALVLSVLTSGGPAAAAGNVPGTVR